MSHKEENSITILHVKCTNKGMIYRYNVMYVYISITKVYLNRYLILHIRIYIYSSVLYFVVHPTKGGSRGFHKRANQRARLQSQFTFVTTAPACPSIVQSQPLVTVWFSTSTHPPNPTTINHSINQSSTLHSTATNIHPSHLLQLLLLHYRQQSSLVTGPQHHRQPTQHQFSVI